VEYLANAMPILHLSDQQQEQRASHGVYGDGDHDGGGLAGYQQASMLGIAPLPMPATVVLMPATQAQGSLGGTVAHADMSYFGQHMRPPVVSPNTGHPGSGLIGGAMLVGHHEPVPRHAPLPAPAGELVVPQPPLTRAYYGLPHDAVVFCNFNQLYVDYLRWRHLGNCRSFRGPSRRPGVCRLFRGAAIGLS